MSFIPHFNSGEAHLLDYPARFLGKRETTSFGAGQLKELHAPGNPQEQESILAPPVMRQARPYLREGLLPNETLMAVPGGLATLLRNYGKLQANSMLTDFAAKARDR